jgi:ABC-type Zn2+ transport system substrate-binding protein/surface adhesin
MINVRKGVFETNSSSTHSITMCNSDDYDKWKNGELLFHRWEESLYTKEQIIKKAKKLKEEAIKRKEEGKSLWGNQEELINATTDEELYNVMVNDEDKDFYTYDEYWEYVDDNYETFVDSYKAKNGEEIIAFGYYGYDG